MTDSCKLYIKVCIIQINSGRELYSNISWWLQNDQKFCIFLLCDEWTVWQWKISEPVNTYMWIEKNGKSFILLCDFKANYSCIAVSLTDFRQFSFYSCVPLLCYFITNTVKSILSSVGLYLWSWLFKGVVSLFWCTSLQHSVCRCERNAFAVPFRKFHSCWREHYHYWFWYNIAVRKSVFRLHIVGCRISIKCYCWELKQIFIYIYQDL